MNRKMSNILSATTGLIMGLSITAMASQWVQAWQNTDINIRINGETQILRDATTGEREYPLTYNGRTYLPLRSIATLLGYNVDFDQNSNSAIVNSPDFVAPQVDPKIETMDLNNLPGVGPLTWKDTLTESGSLLKSTKPVENLMNNLYKEEGSSSNISNYVHPGSTWKQELIDYANQVWKEAASFRTAGGTFSGIGCEPNSVKILSYGYDSFGKCKGCIASYTLTYKVGASGAEKVYSKEEKSVLIFSDNFNLNLTWYANVVEN